MGSKSVTIVNAGVSAPIQIDLNRFQPGVGLICTLTGTGTFKVQVSGDDPFFLPNNWNDHDTLVSLTASQNGNLAYPVTWVRLNASVLLGTLLLSVVQAEAVRVVQGTGIP